MKKFSIIMMAVLALVLGYFIFHSCDLKKENARLANNCEALTLGVQRYRTSDSLNAASVEVLRKDLQEVYEQNQLLVESCHSMDIKLRRVKQASTTETETAVRIEVPVHDTLYIYKEQPVKAEHFAYNDGWTAIDGIINNDSVVCSIDNIDTIIQVVHRVPHKWLCFKWGTKAVRQEIKSLNPHTTIKFSELLEVSK